MTIARLALLMASAALLAAGPVFAHCDSINGPVIVTARAALEKGDVTPVLKWVPADREVEIRSAFRQALAVRGASADARALADRWFFETLVRVHREAEGAPYTGLKGPEYKVEEGIEMADRAVDDGSADAAEKAILAEVRVGLQTRFHEVLEAKKHSGENVARGREFVHAYVEFIHYVERLHESATTPAGHHAEPATHAGHTQ